MSSKSKSGLSETPRSKSSQATANSKASPGTVNNKASPATPRVGKLGRGAAKPESDSHSPLQNSRVSIDKSPRSVNSANPKPVTDRRSPKLAAAPPEKHLPRVPKGSELQAQLTVAQGELQKANEQLVLIEKEKAEAVNELKEAQKLADEANEKLREALVAQKRAEESSEIEKFRAVEIQAGIEAAQKKEDEWQKDLEAVRSQHALDVAALLSTTQELQKAKQELAMNCDAKNRALSHADDATKIAEIHAEKVELLSAELARLKASLDSKLQTEASEKNKMVLELNSEIDSLKQELEKAKEFEEKLLERDVSIEQLNVELEAAKMAESYARNLVEEWKQRIEDLDNRAEKAYQLERSASESLNSVMNQLEDKNDSLHEAEAEIVSLQEKVGLLEISIGRQKGDLMESECQLDVARREALEMEKLVESLRSELETVREEKAQALNNEKLAASSVESLLEEKNKLINDLENSRADEENSKKAMESLASALHEVSVEAREANEKLISGQVEHETYEAQIEDLKMVLKATKEKYETMLDDAKHEIDLLNSTIEQTKNELLNSRADWEQKELSLVNCVKQSEEEQSSALEEIDRLKHLLKECQEEASAAKDEGAQLKDSLKEAETEVVFLKGVIREAKAEGMKLKEALLEKENELQSVIQENKELQSSKAASLEKVDELSKSLEEVLASKKSEESGELTDSEKDYDMLPKVVEFSEENGHVGDEKPKAEPLPEPQKEPKIQNLQEKVNIVKEEAIEKENAKSEELNGKPKEDENKQKENDFVEGEFKMWESCKIEEKDFSPEREQEQDSLEGEVDSKADGGESFDQINGLNIDNGGSSPTKLQEQKKKKPLLRKFGNLLKKKATSNSK